MKRNETKRIQTKPQHSLDHMSLSELLRGIKSLIKDVNMISCFVFSTLRKFIPNGVLEYQCGYRSISDRIWNRQADSIS